MTIKTKERPILFSGEMIRAILDGRKTQTRRVMKPQPPCTAAISKREDGDWLVEKWPMAEREMNNFGRCENIAPPFEVGMRLWVRETWATAPTRNGIKPSLLKKGETIAYRATYSNESHFLWRPSIFMPRWASRITLEIVGVRAERLKDISEADAAAEGVAITVRENGALEPFRKLWDSLNAKRGHGWDKNPWVWKIEFRKL